ncbi:uncharacterized protein N7477_006093 [Penicillium maclennaniae]|uniref:uncharacterized protein n=1 Tax=Penicillium maclennaniae TaxID=1343394 RepID=UPI0025409ADB|nr:uncharacterized protein N7477_006093 [Penicillium maclennaniae]KAJ5670730.1 hypothetical protein N7477_006093 [Penicillium maclennaniae]
MSESKAQVTEIDVLPPTQRGGRVKTHFKKWWWVHLIIFIAVFLIILLPVVYVAYPKIAQHDVNDSTLNITSMVISNPTPESFNLMQTQVIGSHSSFHPKIYAFEAVVSLLGAALPFATVDVPSVTSSDGAKLVVEQTVDLSNASAFGGFAAAVMLNEEVSLNIYGKPGLKEGGLPKTTVTYNKTVTMKGLNKLDGFNVTEFHITKLGSGQNMNGTVFIPNPSVMTISMGNVTLDLSVGGTFMGQSYLNNLTIQPGNNYFPMTSAINQTTILNLISSKDNPYTDGLVPFVITGNSSVYNGKELPYFTQALAANNLTVHLNITEALHEFEASL